MQTFAAETISAASRQALSAALTTLAVAIWGTTQALYGVSFTSLTLVMVVLLRYRR